MANRGDKTNGARGFHPGNNGLATGHGGTVPGQGKGDKVPAKYEPGEVVVSNAMLDAMPGLREQLQSLRKGVLAGDGVTPEQANADAMKGGRLRAALGYEEDKPLAPTGGGLIQYAPNYGPAGLSPIARQQAAPTPPPVSAPATPRAGNGLYPYNMPDKDIYAGAGKPSSAPENRPLHGSITGNSPAQKGVTGTWAAPTPPQSGVTGTWAAPAPQPTGYDQALASAQNNARNQASGARASVDTAASTKAYLEANQKANDAQPSYFAQQTPTSAQGFQRASGEATQALQGVYSPESSASTSAAIPGMAKPFADPRILGNPGTIPNQVKTMSPAGPANPPPNPNQINVTKQPNGVMSFSGGPNIGKDGGDISYTGPAGFKPSGAGVTSMPGANMASASPSSDAALSAARFAAADRGDFGAVRDSYFAQGQGFGGQTRESVANDRLKEIALSPRGTPGRQAALQLYRDGQAGQAQADSNKLAQQEFGIKKQTADAAQTAAGFSTRAAKRIEDLQTAYEAAPAEGRSAIAEQLRVLNKQDKAPLWDGVAIAGSKNIDGSTNEGDVALYNKQTGETRRAGQAGQASAKPMPPKAQLVKGQTYQTPRGPARWDGAQFIPA